MSNRLPVLLEEAKRAHLGSQAAANMEIEHAFEAGRSLIEAKALVGRGGWLPFLADADIPKRTAQRYMALAKSDLKSDTVTLLGGMVPALRFLSLRRKAMALLDNGFEAARNDEFDVAARDMLLAQPLMTEMLEMLGAENAAASVSAGFDRWLGA